MNEFIKNISVSYAMNVMECKPKGNASIVQLMQSKKFEKQVNEMLKISDVKSQKKYKQQTFPVFVPTTFQNSFENDAVSAPAKIIIIDIDAEDNQHLTPSQMFETLMPLPYVAAIATSIRGGGVYAVIRIAPAMKNEDFHRIYNCLENDFKAMGLTIDAACKNIARKRFFGYSNRLYFAPSEPAEYLPIEKKEPEIKAINKPEYSPKLFYKSVEDLVSEIEYRRIDLAPNYDDYLTIAFAFSSEFGEDGRNYFHRVCRQSVKYNEVEADAKYSHAIKANKGKIGISTFYWYCSKAGIYLSDFEAAKGLSANYFPETKVKIPERKKADYPKEWNEPLQANDVNDRWRLINSICNLETAINNDDSEAVIKQIDRIYSFFPNKETDLPIELFAQYAPQALNIILN